MTKEEVLTEGKDGAAGAALAQEDSMTPNTSPSGATVSSTGVGASPPLHLDAVGVYLDVFSGRVKGMKKEFRKLVLATVADKDRWRGACEWWLDQGYNPFSVEKLLNAYLGRKFQSAAKSSFVFNGKKCYRCGLAMRSPKQQCGCANEYAVFVNVLDIGTKESLDATVELAATLL